MSATLAPLLGALGVVGFFVILICWFGMYLRVRREHPDHPLASYSNYVGERKRSWRLVSLYHQLYGFDAWQGGFAIGVALVVVVVLAGFALSAL